MSITQSLLPTLRRTIAGPSRLPLRSLSTTTPISSKKAPSFARPGPPSLPAKDQAEFDALVKANESIGATPAVTEKQAAEIEHKDIRRGARPEFDGDVNPKTGERGGPKVDPFKAGDGDWQYAGRVTDF